MENLVVLRPVVGCIAWLGLWCPSGREFCASLIKGTGNNTNREKEKDGTSGVGYCGRNNMTFSSPDKDAPDCGPNEADDPPPQKRFISRRHMA